MTQTLDMPLRVAVIGYGPIGRLHARAIVDSPSATLVAVCDPDPARRDEARRQWSIPTYASVDDMLNEPCLDAVTIATPDHLHVEPALAAIARGCHVFCEKPLATTLADARRMVEAAADRQVHLSVDYNRRFGAGYRQAWQWLREGAVGRLEGCLIRVTDPVPPAKVARAPHVMLTTLLVHFFDLTRWYGGEVGQLCARAEETAPTGLIHRLTVSLELASGANAMIVGSYRAGQSCTREWLTLVGTTGSIVAENIDQRVILASAGLPQRVRQLTQQATELAIDDSIVAHLREFIDRLVAGRAPSVSARDGLSGMQLAAAAVDSLTSGKPVEVQIA
jgi:predicted dehydrogenase